MATNRELWEQAFAESHVRDADYTTMSGIPLDPVYGPPDDSSGRHVSSGRLGQRDVFAIQTWWM